jgi:hypothetical protein
MGGLGKIFYIRGGRVFPLGAYKNKFGNIKPIALPLGEVGWE